MSLRRSLVVAAFAALFFACVGRVGQDASDSGPPPGDDASSESTLGCPATESFFNGSCRAECTTSATCASGTSCMQVEAGTSLCLPYQSCSYLASDTQCVGTGMYSVYDSREGTEVTVPYESYPIDANPYDVTPYLDPYFDPDTAAGAYTVANGCEGDATFVKVAATGDVACGQVHDVVRCRRSNDVCVLVPGTTTDSVSP